MTVRVRLFAGLRERAGWKEREISAATVAEVWPALGLGDEPDGILYAVNKRYVERIAATRGRRRGRADPTGLGRRIPTQRRAALTRWRRRRGPRRAAGAIATFTGTTRKSSRGRDVVHLDYEAYEGMAESVMKEIAAELQQRYELCAIAIHHRTGRVAIGETSVVIAVSAAHRADALAACRDAIDRLKERAPLWKKEVYADGEEWIGRARELRSAGRGRLLRRSTLTCDVRPRLRPRPADYNPIRQGRDWRARSGARSGR